MRRWLHRVNQRCPWDHNEHFHGWILRNLPARRRRALDLGCGQGALAERLAPHFQHVTGVDRDPGMVAAARLASGPTVEIHRCDIGQYLSTAGEPDLITMVAVLHHLDLHDTLARIARVVAPGGRVLVVGLVLASSPVDLAIDCVSAVANPVMGLLKHSHTQADDQPTMPMKDPTTTWSDLSAAARTHLPGASLRRRLFFRYTLRWDKPA